MKHLPGLATGALLAVVIGCAAKPAQVAAPSSAVTASAEPGMGVVDPRTELDRLDQAITDDMAALALPRPAAPVPACTAGADCAQQMSGAATTATAAAPPTCKPAQTETCTEVCKLKTSICDNAGRICRIAADLGGTDAYANEKCTSGNASCEAAKQRCCGCM